ncbi:uncharacterized protein [Malus domestica]|uniref:uncharacterized protein n=1 Tax=Malus domestica TaxID=3750 RepID=UPI0039748719
MPPRREPCISSESKFPDIGELGEAIANAIQYSSRFPQRAPLETVRRLHPGRGRNLLSCHQKKPQTGSGEVAGFQEVPGSRDREILAVQVPYYVAGAIIGILGSVGKTTQPYLTPLGYELEFSMLRGETCYINWVYQGCPVLVEDVVMAANLVPLDIVDFDVILGMDWLHYNRAKMDCYKKTVTFHRPGLPMVTFIGVLSGLKHDIISAVRANRLLRKGCQGYLAHVVLNEDTPTCVEDVRVVRHFPDVFSDDLLGLPPDREVEFTIDLLLGIYPISLTPYRMAPAELRELKIQLQELVDKGFIQPSTSHWGAPVLFCIDDLFDQLREYHLGRVNVVADALNRKSRGRINALYAYHIPLLIELRSTGVDLGVIDREEALLASFQVRPILIDRVLEAQVEDEESQELAEAVSRGKKKDLRIWESDGMLMQGSRMYVPNITELKKDILDEAHISAYAMHPESTKMYHTIRLSTTGLEALGSRLHYSTTYHPQTDGQSERTIQTLEDMLRSSVLQFGDAWHKRLDLMEFAYNNNYHSSIGMSHFKALYGKSCHTPLCWLEVGERVLVGPKIVDETTQNIQVIKANLKAQDRQKSLVDKHATDRVYKVGDWVFLKLSLWKGVVWFGKKGKLSLRYIGPYQITERVGEVAYRLKLPSELSQVHDVFHVSMFRHYVSDPAHVIPPQTLEINPDLTYDEEPVTILDWKDKVLRNKTIRMVKVLWRNHSIDEAT